MPAVRHAAGGTSGGATVSDRRRAAGGSAAASRSRRRNAPSLGGYRSQFPHGQVKPGFATGSAAVFFGDPSAGPSARGEGPLFVFLPGVRRTRFHGGLLRESNRSRSGGGWTLRHLRASAGHRGWAVKGDGVHPGSSGWRKRRPVKRA